MDRGTAARLKNAVAWIRAGKTAKAQKLLVDLLRSEPENAQAWYLLSYALDDNQRKQYAVLQAIQKDPEFRLARKRLAQLRGEPWVERQAAPKPLASEFSSQPGLASPVEPKIPEEPQSGVEEPAKQDGIFGPIVRMVLFGLFALVLTLSAFAAYQIYFPKSAVVPTPSVTSSPTATFFPTRTPVPTITPTPEISIAPVEVATLRAAEQSAIDAIEQQVSELRGLSATGEVAVGMVSENDAILLLADLYFNEQKALELQQQELILRALGLLAETDHLTDYELFRHVDPLGGLFAFAQNRIYLVGESLGGVSPLSFSRLYDRALVTQTYTPGVSQVQNCPIFADGCRALNALMQGDVSLLGSQWFDDFASEETQSAANEIATASVDGMAQLDFVSQEFAFPEQYGLGFVQSIFDAGGWMAVDAVYGSPPASSEQILHPAKYSAGEVPTQLNDPSFAAAFGSGWEPLGDGELGEWLTYLVLSHGALGEARQSEAVGLAAAAGWGGDAMQAYLRKSDGAVALAQHWAMDSLGDSSELRNSMAAYLAGRYVEEASQLGTGTCWVAGGQRSCLYVDGSEVLWLVGPDEIVVLQVMLTHFPQFQ